MLRNIWYKETHTIKAQSYYQIKICRCLLFMNSPPLNDELFSDYLIEHFFLVYLYAWEEFKMTFWGYSGTHKENEASGSQMEPLQLSDAA